MTKKWVYDAVSGQRIIGPIFFMAQIQRVHEQHFGTILSNAQLKKRSSMCISSRITQLLCRPFMKFLVK
jgi:hypothetical protein